MIRWLIGALLVSGLYAQNIDYNTQIRNRHVVCALGVCTFTGVTATSGNYLRGNGSGFVSAAIQESDVPAAIARDAEIILGVGNLSTAGRILKTATAGTATESTLLLEGTNLIEQRNGTNAQQYCLYATYTDASNYERACLATADNGGLTIEAGTAGTGEDNLNLTLVPSGTGYVLVGSNLQIYTGTSGSSAALASIRADAGDLLFNTATSGIVHFFNDRAGTMLMGNATAVAIGTTDLDGTPAIGRLVVQGDGTNAILIGRSGAGANVASLSNSGDYTLNAVILPVGDVQDQLDLKIDTAGDGILKTVTTVSVDDAVIPRYLTSTSTPTTGGLRDFYIETDLQALWFFPVENTPIRLQNYDADLAIYAGITPSANVQSFLGAADYSAMRTQLGLVIGTNVQAFDAALAALAALTSTDHAIARFDGTGASIQDSAVTIGDTGILGLPDNIRQTFNPGADAAGLNVGSHAGDPGTPSNGDVWYDSTANELTARINGANVALGAGGGTTIRWHEHFQGANRETSTTEGGRIGCASTAGCTGAVHGANGIGVAVFADSGAAVTGLIHMRLPAEFVASPAPSLTFVAVAGTITSGTTAVLTAETGCVGAAEDYSAATFNTRQDVVFTPGAINQTRYVELSSLTMTGCAAGEVLQVRIGRDSACAGACGGSSTDDLAANVNIPAVILSFTRNLN